MNTSFIIELATATAAANATVARCSGAGDTSKNCGFYFYLFLGIFGPLSLVAMCIYISEDMAKKRKEKQRQIQPADAATPSISSQEPVGTLNYSYV
jgi:hypothetical protein